MLIEGLALLAASWSTAADHIPVRTVSVPHQGATLDVRYGAEVTIETRQIGMSPPNRPSTARCMWRAVMKPERKVIGLDTKPVAALERRFDGQVIASGSQHGQCTGSRPFIEQQVAAAAAKAAPEKLAALVEHDVHTLNAELAALATLSKDAG